jgi:hypothetical protein
MVSLRSKSSRTIKLYDRARERLRRDEVEKDQVVTISQLPRTSIKSGLIIAPQADRLKRPLRQSAISLAELEVSISSALTRTFVSRITRTGHGIFRDGSFRAAVSASSIVDCSASGGRSANFARASAMV